MALYTTFLLFPLISCKGNYGVVTDLRGLGASSSEIPALATVNSDAQDIGKAGKR